MAWRPSTSLRIQQSSFTDIGKGGPSAVYGSTSNTVPQPPWQDCPVPPDCVAPYKLHDSSAISGVLGNAPSGRFLKPCRMLIAQALSSRLDGFNRKTLPATDSPGPTFVVP